MSTRHTILGLLTQAPMSGYDIKSLFKGLSWLIDTPSYGSLYPTLHALLEEGLVTVDVEANPGKPPRKLYSITDEGQQVLRRWVNEKTAQEASIRTFVRHLIMAGSMSPADLRKQLAQRRLQILDYLGGANGKAGEAQSDDDLGQQLVRGYGEALAKAELVWLEGQLSQLTHPPA